jgi:hypothetical protein
MICAQCGNQTEEEIVRCPVCSEDGRLAGRYLLRQVLGQRGSGTTYLGSDGEQEVVVKEMLLRRTAEMKEIELFGREAELLGRLDVEGVPEHYEHFEERRGKTVALYNVLEYIDGVSIEEELRRRRPSNEEVLRLLADVAEILARLREQDPPVVHRDIKPANLIRRRGDDRVFLIDFGVARAVAESLHFAGSTVTGTFGYMAPEQLYGHAEPASDVYGLGATAIRMFTGREPHELLDDDRRFDWRGEANVPGSVADTVGSMIAWEPAERPSDLSALARDLRKAARGDTAALERFAGTRTLTVGATGRVIARPGMGEVMRELSREPELARGASFGTAAIVVGMVLILGASIPSLLLKGGLFTLFTMAIVGIALASPEFRAALRRLARYRLGESTRGIVTERRNEEGRFRVKYQFEVDGERREGEHVVSSNWYFAVEEGDEVDVFFSASEPEKSAFRPHPVRRGSAPVQ